MSPTPQQYVAQLLAASGSGPALDQLVARVERASVPGRGPEATAPLRLAAGVVAELLLARDLPPAPSARAPRRGVLLVGAPEAVAASRAASGLPARAPRKPSRVVVLARPLDTALADVWAHHVRQGVNRTWGGMTARRVAVGQLPARIRFAAVAARWAERVGPERVHVVTRPGPLTGITRAPLHVVHPAPPAAALELVRATGATLGFLTDAETHRRLLDEVLHPLLAAEHGPAPALRPRLLPWLEDRAAGMGDAIRRGGYALHGVPADLAPQGAGVAWPGSAQRQPAVLAVAVRTLLALGEASSAPRREAIREESP